MWFITQSQKRYKYFKSRRDSACAFVEKQCECGVPRKFAIRRDFCNVWRNESRKCGGYRHFRYHIFTRSSEDGVAESVIHYRVTIICMWASQYVHTCISQLLHQVLVETREFLSITYFLIIFVQLLWLNVLFFFFVSWFISMFIVVFETTVPPYFNDIRCEVRR